MVKLNIKLISLITLCTLIGMAFFMDWLNTTIETFNFSPSQTLVISFIFFTFVALLGVLR